MKKNAKTDSGGWFDCHVIVSAGIFVVLMLCSLYFEIKILKYLSFFPAAYAVLRTFMK